MKNRTKIEPFALDAYLSERRKRIEKALLRCVRSSGNGQLGKAVHYSVIGGGKRLRPILVLAACEAVGGDPALAIPSACAIEMIHCYSLVHDDLPAMDDDDLRRGRPTVHKAFNEAAAILAGDALLTEALTLLADPVSNPGLRARTRASLVRALGQAAGWQGMVLGQALDLEAEGKQIGLAQLKRLHAAKTGALLTASLVMGALVGEAEPKEIRALERYGRAIGLAFQIVDDVLDITSDTKTLGKPVGSDQEKDKSTFPRLLGIERSMAEAQKLIKQAKRALSSFGPAAEPLRALADYVVERAH